MALSAAEASQPPPHTAGHPEASAAASARTSGTAGASAMARGATSAAAASDIPPGPVGTGGPPAGAAPREDASAPTYHAVTTGQPADPRAVQAAAIAQQQAMYAGFGAPYSLHVSGPPSYRGGASPQYHPALGAPGAAAPYYTMKPPTMPGPCYYDPYGMLNPAACIAPMRLSPEDPLASTKLLSARKPSRWCC